MLAQEEDIDVEASHRGLVLRGETESAFEGPVEILREYFGDQIRVGNPTVRYHNGTCFEEPHMGLRVRCLPEYVESVLADLESRRASIIDRGVTPAYGVIRATAPLANLLGYSRSLTEFTAASAHLAIWLSHYAPVEVPPPDGEAA